MAANNPVPETGATPNAPTQLARMLIDGEWVDSADGRRQSVRNPGTGEIIDSVPIATEGDLRRAIVAAQRGKEAMRRLPAHERARILSKVGRRLLNDREELAVLLARENGKPIRQTREEVSAAARIFQGFAEEAKRVFGRVIPMDAVPGLELDVGITVREPVGVVAAIVPFNYPVELYAHKVAAALAAGNAVIGKPPSECPLALLRLAAIIEAAGLPQGGHQMVTGPGSLVGPILAGDPGIQLITVTGSVEVGVELSRLAAPSLKKVHAELGGNDAFIVCADADVARAAEAIVLGRLARGNGQICCAVKRVFVHESLSHELAMQLTERVRHLQVGDQLDEATDVGPLITEAAAERVEASIAEAVRAGARVVAGGVRRGAFVEPTVVIDVPRDASAFRSEVFGPVVPLVTFSSIDEAVLMANDSPYGLQAAVFTRDVSTAFEIAHRLEAGGVIVNWSSALRAENLPFGGVKLSGHGREGIHDTLEEMTIQKVILFHDVLGGSGGPQQSATT